MKAIATVSMYDMGAANRNGAEALADRSSSERRSSRKLPSSAMSSSPAAKPNTPAERCMS